MSTISVTTPLGESPVTTNKKVSWFEALRFEDVWIKSNAKGEMTCAVNQKNYKDSTLQMKLVWEERTLKTWAVPWLGCCESCVRNGRNVSQDAEMFGFWMAVLNLILGSAGICLWDQGFIVAFREHSSADPTIGHMLGSAVLAPLDRAAVTTGHFRTDRQVLQSRKGYKYSCAPVILKPILNHQKVISTHVFSMLGLANAVFLDCYLKKKNVAVLKGKIKFLSKMLCEGASQCLSRFGQRIFCFHSCPSLLLRGFLDQSLGSTFSKQNFLPFRCNAAK
ncbi:uncharacterized protein LOC115606210 [Strigops habroptila]|uniref:uncharacterized protein LOC115606210 n=1 Tax=Strigops habroptila TaxID=2489341 RepID=UPI0011CF32AC|nr:uncharacterized protein LOC115606210 [Strigops habroptila]